MQVAYWGQDSSGTEKSLASYCLDGTYDIIVVGFADVWGTGGDLQINLANQYAHHLHLSSFHLFIIPLIVHLFLFSCGDVFPGTALLNCPQVGKDIQVCQQKGKRVFLSMGGASGAYGLANDGQAQGLAAQVWNLFLGGSSPTRPFGNAKLDGIDLDIEAGDPSHFGAFVRSLKANFTTDPSKHYYISYFALLRSSSFVLLVLRFRSFAPHRHSPGLHRSARSLMPTTDPTTPAAHLTPDWSTTSGSRYDNSGLDV